MALPLQQVLCSYRGHFVHSTLCSPSCSLCAQRHSSQFCWCQQAMNKRAACFLWHQSATSRGPNAGCMLDKLRSAASARCCSVNSCSVAFDSTPRPLLCLRAATDTRCFMNKQCSCQKLGPFCAGASSYLTQPSCRQSPASNTHQPCWCPSTASYFLLVRLGTDVEAVRCGADALLPHLSFNACEAVAVPHAHPCGGPCRLFGATLLPGMWTLRTANTTLSHLNLLT